MTELMEPKYGMTHWSKTTLPDPQEWGEAIQDFQRKTERLCICALLKHPFLNCATNRGCLAAAVFMTRDLVPHDYEQPVSFK
jgi:hypothetical protein